MSRGKRDEDVGFSFSWCPDCKYWIPAEEMHYDICEDTGKLTRVCSYCLGLKPLPNNASFVKDEERELVECVYCDSSNVEYLGTDYKCKDCGSRFIL